MSFHTEFVFEQLSDDLKEEIIDFWVTENALNEDKARQRVDQVALIARTDQGQLIGVSTMFKRHYQPIGKTFFVFRGFVAEPYRRSGVVLNLLKAAKAKFNERFQQGKDPEVLGMMLKVQNPYLMKGLNQAVTPRTGFVYVGMEDDCHIRIHYFEHAKIA